MIRNSKYISLVLIAIIFVGMAEGGSKRRRGTAGAQELMIPVGSRGAALSGAYVAGLSGIEAAEWNIAGLANISGSGEAIFSNNQWIADLSLNYGAVAAKLGNNVFGISIKSVDFGDIPITTTDEPEGTGEIYSPSFITMSFMFARKMSDRIFFGADMKMISEKIMRVSAFGLAIDAGVQYRTGTGLQLGASIRNLGLDMKFDGSDLEEFHQPSGTEPGTPIEHRRIVLQAFELPTTIELGVGYGPIDFGPAKATFAGSFLNNNFSFDEIRLGAEISLMNMLSLRGGIAIGIDPEPYGVDMIQDTDDDSDDDAFENSTEEFIWGPTIGFGLDLSRLTGMGLSVDYAYRTAEYFDGVQWLTFKVAF